VPRITAFKPQRNGKRVNVYLDDRFGFGIDLENYVKLNLRVEQELTEDEIKKIVQEAEFAKVLERLLSFAMLRPRSEREIETWFSRKRVHASMQKKLERKLRKYDLIGDRKFAKWWVGQRLQFKFKSRRELEYELRKKGIGSNLIKEVMDTINPSDEKTAKELLMKNMRKWEKLPEDEKRKKMWGYLGRKGFGWEVVKKVCSEID